LQWVGVAVLLTSLLLVRSTDLMTRGVNPSGLLVRDMAGVQFQRIAFHRAFGKAHQDNEFGVMSKITTEEMRAIRRMMGAESPVDPFPLSKNVYLTDEQLAAWIEPNAPDPQLPPPPSQ
ncbi:MAG: hypothetical protein IH587_07035, partial [Anaerolineae bacterium]|nr:hypothetical protein [Anaerolineae bacterium]